jgi:hypothetical protein
MYRQNLKINQKMANQGLSMNDVSTVGKGRVMCRCIFNGFPICDVYLPVRYFETLSLS